MARKVRTVFHRQSSGGHHKVRLAKFSELFPDTIVEIKRKDDPELYKRKSRKTRAREFMTFYKNAIKNGYNRVNGGSIIVW